MQIFYDSDIFFENELKAVTKLFFNNKNISLLQKNKLDKTALEITENRLRLINPEESEKHAKIHAFLKEYQSLIHSELNAHFENKRKKLIEEEKLARAPKIEKERSELFNIILTMQKSLKNLMTALISIEEDKRKTMTQDQVADLQTIASQAFNDQQYITDKESCINDSKIESERLFSEENNAFIHLAKAELLEQKNITSHDALCKSYRFMQNLKAREKNELLRTTKQFDYSFSKSTPCSCLTENNAMLGEDILCFHCKSKAFPLLQRNN